MKNQDYKLKYADLKLKFHDSIDVAFRLGFEQGLQQAQVQQAQQAQAASMNAVPEQEEQSNELDQEQSNGSELDQHIGHLESMLKSTKPGSSEQSQLQKSIDGIKAFQSDLKQKYELRKSEKTIAAIGKAMKAPFTLGKSATKNLSENGKRALNMQEQIVQDVMKSFAEEEARTTEAIKKTLNLEQLLKE